MITLAVLGDPSLCCKPNLMCSMGNASTPYVIPFIMQPIFHCPVSISSTQALCSSMLHARLMIPLLGSAVLFAQSLSYLPSSSSLISTQETPQHILRFLFAHSLASLHLILSVLHGARDALFIAHCSSLIFPLPTAVRNTSPERSSTPSPLLISSQRTLVYIPRAAYSDALDIAFDVFLLPLGF